MKWAKDMNRNFTEEDIHTYGQQAHEKMLSIICHQGNTNQNHNEIPPHTSENGENQQGKKQQMLVRMWRKGEPSSTVGGNASWYSHSGKQYGGSSKS